LLVPAQSATGRWWAIAAAIITAADGDERRHARMRFERALAQAIAQH
jgi:hypothetical protein